MTVIKDDRTPEQRLSHVWGVVGTDSFLSGWGLAEGGTSYAVWACERVGSMEVAVAFDALYARIQRRTDMKRVRVVYLPDYKPRSAAHVHIYVDSGREFVS